MPELIIEIDLDAPPERVSSVLTDFAAYPEWNHYQTIEGKAEPMVVVTVSSRALDGQALRTIDVGVMPVQQDHCQTQTKHWLVVLAVAANGMAPSVVWVR